MKIKSNIMGKYLKKSIDAALKQQNFIGKSETIFFSFILYEEFIENFFQPIFFKQFLKFSSLKLQNMI